MQLSVKEVSEIEWNETSTITQPAKHLSQKVTELNIEYQLNHKYILYYICKYSIGTLIIFLFCCFVCKMEYVRRTLAAIIMS